MVSPGNNFTARFLKIPFFFLGHFGKWRSALLVAFASVLLDLYAGLPVVGVEFICLLRCLCALCSSFHFRQCCTISSGFIFCFNAHSFVLFILPFCFQLFKVFSLVFCRCFWCHDLKQHCVKIVLSTFSRYQQPLLSNLASPHSFCQFFKNVSPPAKSWVGHYVITKKLWHYRK